MTLFSFIKILNDENQTLEFGSEIAACCTDTAVIYLEGDLGAGKTTLARGMLRGFGYEGKVKSPTYTIVEPYDVNGKPIFHFDFYRLQDAQELEYLGIQDYFIPGAICLVEWPERSGDLLPPADLSCYIVPHDNGREVRIEAHTDQGKDILKRIIRIEAE